MAVPSFKEIKTPMAYGIRRLSQIGVVLGLMVSVGGCVSSGEGPIGFSILMPTDGEARALQQLTTDGQVKIKKPGEIFSGLSDRAERIAQNHAGGICRSSRMRLNYTADVETRKFFKDPNELRKTPFAEILTHKLIVSSSKYFGTGDTKAADYAIRIMTGYAQRDYPALFQDRRYSHTLSSAAQFLFAASIAHTMLLPYEGYPQTDQELVADWLKRKALGPHIKYKDKSKWFGHDGVRGQIKTVNVSGYDVNCCTPAGYESARLQVDNTLMVASILFHDDAAFASALKGYIDLISTARADGSLPYQTARGNAALWYQNLGINVLVMAAEMAANQGVDLYRYEAPSGATLHTAIAFLARAMARPELIFSYAKRNINPWRKGNGIVDPDDHTKQLGQFKIPKLQRNGASFLAWFEPYQRRFPDHPNIKLMQEITAKLVDPKSSQSWNKVSLPYAMHNAKSRGGLFNDYTGTNLSCVFKNLTP
ncbi:alginate lyase family protein [Alphaproteobacteria bacterium]|nr:alginate lyase family protein [Alphaproteobacteria bacterium]